MKKTLFIASIACILFACGNKKSESTDTSNEVKKDTLKQVDTTAIKTLAFSPLPGYFIKNTVSLSDTVNFMLISSREEFDDKFGITVANEISKPDFVINYTVAVACLPTMNKTTIVMDKVERGDEAMNVYLTITRGEKQAMSTKPVQIFSIERLFGFSEMQFFVNGKKDKAIGLPVD